MLPPYESSAAAATGEVDEPVYCLVEHVVALAEREADERTADLGVVAEHRRGDAHHARFVRKGAGERLAVVDAEWSHVDKDEVRRLRHVHVDADSAEPVGEPVAAQL